MLEPAVFALGLHHLAARALVHEVRALWDQDLPNEDWVIRFLKAVGSDPDVLTPELIAAAVPFVPVLRRGRPFWDSDLPLAELAAAPFPKLVISGGHSAGFDAMCDDLAERIGASRAVAAGAGHEIQFTGRPLTSCCSRCGAERTRGHVEPPTSVRRRRSLRGLLPISQINLTSRF